MASSRPETQPRPFPLPLDRVVRWLPLDDSSYLLPAVLLSTNAEPLVVAQDAILQVESHLRAAQPADAFGILHGSICICPRSLLRYLLVEGTIPGQPVAAGPDPQAAMAAELGTLAQAAEREGTRVVGWYRSGATIVPRASLRDTGLHCALFPDPSQVALLRDGPGPQNRGAFMRVEPVNGRPYCIPFHELLPPPPEHGTGVRGASITWSNYRAESYVTPLQEPASAGATAAPEPSAQPKPHPPRRRLFTLLPGFSARRYNGAAAPAAMAPVETNAEPAAAERASTGAANPEVMTPEPPPLELVKAESASPAPSALVSEPLDPAAPESLVLAPARAESTVFQPPAPESGAPPAGTDAPTPTAAAPAPDVQHPVGDSIDRLFGPPEAGQRSAQASEPPAGAPASRPAGTDGAGKPASGWTVKPPPFWRRRKTRWRAFIVAAAAAALVAARRVHNMRAEQRMAQGGEVDTHLSAPSRKSPVIAVRDAHSLPPQTLGTDSATAHRTFATDSAAIARFARASIDAASDDITRDLTAFGAALTDARDSLRRADACARADSAYVRALMNVNAITLARHQLLHPLDSAQRGRVRALASDVDAMPGRIRAACR